jgi:prepilin signal peptidase PulO-like enzyme (type II secretory pathway)
LVSGVFVVLWSAVGALVGYFAIAPVAATLPEPDPLPSRGRIVVVVMSALLFGLVAYQFQRWWVVIPYSGLFAVLLTVSVIDLRVYRIPDRVVFPALFVSIPVLAVAAYGLGLENVSVWQFMQGALVGMAAYFLILFPFNLIYPKGMGFGDVKLALLMGLFLGWLGAGVDGGSLFQGLYYVMIALLLGCVFGVIFGLGVRFVRRAGGAFPFGPALALGVVWVVLNYESYIIAAGH